MGWQPLSEKGAHSRLTTVGGQSVELDERHVPVLVVGGGQAGLAISYCLTQRGLEHLVLERDTMAHNWYDARWDSFCLVTPNWQCQLPGWPYTGDDPDGFMLRDEIIEYLRGYAESFSPPLVEGVTVHEVKPRPEGGYAVATSAGDLTAAQIVVATGGYHTPIVPPLSARLPRTLTQLHSSEYRSPDRLPAGEVLVVGSAQSGAQIAEDLHLAGRTVHLAVGKAPRMARFYRGRDVVAWLGDMHYYDMPIDDHPQGEAARHNTNHYVTGRDGGRDIDLRAFARDGMRLYGRLSGAEGSVLSFADDLAVNLDNADRVAEAAKDTVDAYIAANGIQAPQEERYTPVWQPRDVPTEVDVEAAGITSVIWATGFRTDYRWLKAPVFDGSGDPVHRRGVTSTPGLYFLGLPWLYTWGSGRFGGIARDAEHIAEVALRTSARVDLAGERRHRRRPVVIHAAELLSAG
jgi:putative flavoprotein involved in K+ transport